MPRGTALPMTGTAHPTSSPVSLGEVAAHLTDVETFRQAVESCVAVHLITFNGEFGETLTNGTELVAAAEAAGVQRVSVLSGWDESTVEPALRESDLDWALLAPVESMSNAREWALEIVSERRVRTLADWPCSPMEGRTMITPPTTNPSV